MQFPLDFSVFHYSLSSHLIFETLGYFIGFRYFLFLRKTNQDPLPESNRIWVIIGATFGAFMFSRLLGALENPSEFFSSDAPFLYFYSHKSIVGGLLGGLLVVEIVKMFLKEKSSSGDLFTYPLILAMMIGRIGCFTMGVHEPTYGLESELPWALDLGDGIMRHPVAIYEILFLGLLWIVLRSLEQRVRFRNGLRFKYFMIAYLMFRFFADFIKPVYLLPTGTSSIQLACLLGLTYYAKTIFLTLTRSRTLKIT
jgi:phosphatidylglycerol---prolipoprotein diacylglyceryl transferase